MIESNLITVSVRISEKDRRILSTFAYENEMSFSESIRYLLYIANENDAKYLSEPFSKSYIDKYGQSKTYYLKVRFKKEDLQIFEHFSSKFGLSKSTLIRKLIHSINFYN